MKKLIKLMCVMTLGFCSISPVYAGFKEHFDLGRSEERRVGERV